MRVCLVVTTLKLQTFHTQEKKNFETVLAYTTYQIPIIVIGTSEHVMYVIIICEMQEVLRLIYQMHLVSKFFG